MARRFPGARYGDMPIEGLSDIIKSIRFTQERHAEGIEAGLIAAGGALLEWSQELVPVDTGLLHDSGQVSVTGKGYETLVEVAYGSSGAYYAIYVHEDMNVYHPNGQAKFLEQPARERRPELREIVREEVIKRRGKR